MPVIDFKEIPEAHVASGEQDMFELFAADFLEMLGYEILDRPSRGPDLGKDLLVCELRRGISGETSIRWLVSCKHKAHSGRAVSVDDELNIIERVEGKRCDGFLAFYSSVPSSSLATRLRELESHFTVQIFDSGLIEQYLLSEHGLRVAARYFPVSFQEWQIEHPQPANLFDEPARLMCERCDTDLLSPSPSGILVLWQPVDRSLQGVDEFVDVHWCCKGRCDEALERRIRAQHTRRIVNGWVDLPELCMPLMFLRRLMAFVNGFKNGDRWSDEAFEKWKTVIIAVFQHVSREATSKERERIRRLSQLPDYI